MHGSGACSCTCHSRPSGGDGRAFLPRVRGSPRCGCSGCDVTTTSVSAWDARTVYTIIDAAVPLPVYHPYVLHTAVLPSRGAAIGAQGAVPPPEAAEAGESLLPHRAAVRSTAAMLLALPAVDTLLHAAAKPAAAAAAAAAAGSGASLSLRRFRGLHLSNGPIRGEAVAGGHSGAVGDDDDDDDDDDDGGAGSVAVEETLVCFVPGALTLRGYTFAVPATSGWAIVTDGSKFLVGMRLGRNADPQRALNLPLVLSFAFRFRRSISASNAISARLCMEFSVGGGDDAAEGAAGTVVKAGAPLRLTWAEDTMLSCSAGGVAMTATEAWARG